MNGVDAAAQAGQSAGPFPWKKLLVSVEKTAVGAVSTFLGSVAAFSGGAWDAKHLEAAAVGAAAAAAYQLSGTLNSYLTG